MCYVFVFTTYASKNNESLLVVFYFLFSSIVFSTTSKPSSGESNTIINCLISITMFWNYQKRGDFITCDITNQMIAKIWCKYIHKIVLSLKVLVISFSTSKVVRGTRYRVSIWDSALKEKELETGQAGWWKETTCYDHLMWEIRKATPQRLCLNRSN